MTVFYCSKCGCELTGDLVVLPAVPDVDDPDDGRGKKSGQARSTVPRGCCAIDPEPWGADCMGPNELHLDPVRVYAG
ncbi:hypothetical protein [Streptomyces sp. NPDC093018]|uniref:hypothetical protein n=1 Tax=Streptomyces sp. NPDC093018 TaxID=3155067 RepID=UPI0034419744